MSTTKRQRTRARPGTAGLARLAVGAAGLLVCASSLAQQAVADPPLATPRIVAWAIEGAADLGAGSAAVTLRGSGPLGGVSASRDERGRVQLLVIGHHLAVAPEDRRREGADGDPYHSAELTTDVSIPPVVRLVVTPREQVEYRVITEGDVVRLELGAQGALATSSARRVADSGRGASQASPERSTEPEPPVGTSGRSGRGREEETALGVVEPLRGLNVRAAPDAEAEILGAVPQGAELRLLGQEGEWLRVVWDDDSLEGWSASRWIVRLDSAAAPAAGEPSLGPAVRAVLPERPGAQRQLLAEATDRQADPEPAVPVEAPEADAPAPPRRRIGPEDLLSEPELELLRVREELRAARLRIAELEAGAGGSGPAAAGADTGSASGAAAEEQALRIAELVEALEGERDRVAGLQYEADRLRAQVGELAARSEAERAAQLEIQLASARAIDRLSRHVEALDGERRSLLERLQRAEAELAADGVRAARGGDAATSNASPDGLASPAAAGWVAAPAELAAEARAWLEDWLGAWSDGDVGGYAGRYVDDYRGESESPASWLAERAARLEAPEWIDVQARDLAVLVRSAGAEDRSSAELRLEFVQEYRSDLYSDVTRKTLDLRRSADGDGWRIVEESAGPAEP